MYEKFGQFIDGKWQQAEKKETYDVINPATEEVIGKASMNCPNFSYIDFLFLSLLN